MKKYVILKTNVKEYDRIIICLSYNSLLTYIHEIENNLKENIEIKCILIDQLLITGNTSNRFVKCNVLQGKLNLDTVKRVKCSDYVKKETIEWLNKHYRYVKKFYFNR